MVTPRSGSRIIHKVRVHHGRRKRKAPEAWGRYDYEEWEVTGPEKGRAWIQRK